VNAEDHDAAVVQAYHDSDPFPMRIRQSLIKTLTAIAASAPALSVQQLEAQELIAEIERLPHRSNQALWEQLGGKGEAPKHFSPGADALWNEFERGESWLTWSRAMMHMMPDDWQGRMAVLKREFTQHFTCSKVPREECFETTVRAKRDGKLVPIPEHLNNYRHLDRAALERYR
jgi:ribonuclease I